MRGRGAIASVTGSGQAHGKCSGIKNNNRYICVAEMIISPSDSVSVFMEGELAEANQHRIKIYSERVSNLYLYLGKTFRNILICLSYF